MPAPEDPFPPFETLLTRIEGSHVLVVTMNRPEVGNARNTRMAQELLAVWTRLAEAPGQIRCAVLTGAGEKLFSGGGDLKERKGMTDEAWQAQHRIFEQGRDALLASQVPVIAAVNGHAYGGGCEAALLCDFVYAVRGARFALPEVTRGILPGSGGTQMLPRAVGERRAKEIILSGRPFTSEEAHDWGLVNRLCERDELMAAVLDTATAIAGNAPLAVKEAKRSIQHGMEVEIHRGLEFEIEAYNRLVASEDRREGVLAFNEKRTPQWKGR